MTRPSVIPTSREVRQYVRQTNCLTIIPQAGPVHPYVSHVSRLSVIMSYQQVRPYGSPVTHLSAIHLVTQGMQFVRRQSCLSYHQLIPW